MFVFVEVVVPYKNIVTANADGTRNDAADTELFFYDLNDGWYEMDSEKNTDDGTITHLYVYGTEDACVNVEAGVSVSPFSTVTVANAIEGQDLEGTDANIVVNAYAIQAENLAESQNESNPSAVWEIIMNQSRGE